MFQISLASHDIVEELCFFRIFLLHIAYLLLFLLKLVIGYFNKKYGLSVFKILINAFFKLNYIFLNNIRKFDLHSNFLGQIKFLLSISKQTLVIQDLYF